MLIRRTGIVTVAVALAFLGAGTGPATAEETPPPVNSSPGDPFGGRTPPPGPVFVITPDGDGTGELPTPADPDDVASLIERDRQEQGGDSSNPTGTATDSSPSSTPAPGVTPAPGEGAPASVDEQGAADSSDSSSNPWWWAAGSTAALVLAAVAYLAWRRRDRTAADSLDGHAS